MTSFGAQAFLQMMTTKRQVRGQHGRCIYSRHSDGVDGIDRPASNRVGFVNDVWFSKLGDVRPKHRAVTIAGGFGIIVYLPALIKERRRERPIQQESE